MYLELFPRKTNNRHHTQVRTLSHKSTVARGWWMLKHAWDV
jgi:hypothetical protein